MRREEAPSAHELREAFPDEAAAVAWFEAARWPEGRFRPRRGGRGTVEVANRRPRPYRCKDCRKHFSRRTGTPMQASKPPVREWLQAARPTSASRKGLSSFRLARELGIAQEGAWRLGHKIREAWNPGAPFAMSGAAEAGETCIGGREKNKRAGRKLRAGRGAAGEQPATGVRERGTGKVAAFLIEGMDRGTPRPRVRARVEPGSRLHADGRGGHRGTRECRRGPVARHAGGHVRGRARQRRGIVLALLKRGRVGAFRRLGVERLSRCVDESRRRRNNKDLHALELARRRPVEGDGA